MRPVWLASVVAVISGVSADSFAKQGCYKVSSVSLTLSDSYTWQSSGHCIDQCAGKRVLGLLDGKYCYCGDTDPDTSDEVSSSYCDVNCSGYPEEKCGGDGYYLVYVNSDVDNEDTSSASASASKTETSKASSTSASRSSGSSASSASSASSTSSQSSGTSSSSPTSSSSDKSSTSSSTDSSAGPVTVVSTVHASGTQSVIYRTITPSSTSTSDAQNNNNLISNTHKKSSGLSGGAIAGIVVGVVVGVALIVLAAFMLWRRHKSDEEDIDDQFTLSGPEKGDIGPVDPNPFLLAGGYNSFNTHQHKQQNSYDDNSQNRNSSLGGANEPHTYSQLAYGGGSSAHTSNSGSNDHSRSTSAGFMHAAHNSFTDRDFYEGDHRPPSPEMGRRKLSNGSLPDMIARQPGSLKVVNN